MRKSAVYALVLSLLLALFGPAIVTQAAINYPSVFGQLTGDCTTPGSGSYATTCTKLNGVSPGTAFSQNTGTSGANVPLLNGTNTWSNTQTFAAVSATTGAFSGAISGTTETLTGLLTGVGNSFTGLSTQTGGHVIGTGDYTASQTLTTANEDSAFTCTAACTATLPATPANGTPINVQDTSTTAGFVTVAASGTGTKVLTPTGPATSFTYSQLYQGAKWIYHSGPNLWIAE